MKILFKSLLVAALGTGLAGCMDGGSSSSAPAAVSDIVAVPTTTTIPVVQQPIDVPVVTTTSTTSTTMPAQPYSFGGGQGIQSQPYILQNSEDVKHIADFPAAYYWLNNDINMQGVSFSSLPAFSGTIYGNNYRLMNLTITATTGATAALFTSVSGTIVQLKLTGVNIVGQAYAAGFAGQLSGTISACTISGNITSPSGGNGFNTGVGNSIYVSKTLSGSVVNTAQNVMFNNNHVTNSF